MSKQYLDHFNRFITATKIIDDNDSVVVSFSGGVDSVVLVDLLIKSKKISKIKIIHFNHQNRIGNMSDEKFVLSFCRKNNLEHKIIRLDNLANNNFEKEARQLRYRYLREESQGAKVLLGHHIDDSFEWSLMQSFKSSSLTNSIGIPLVNGRLVRPLMCFTKKQIEQYAKLNNLNFCIDPTNLDIKYERNYIRSVVIAKIKEKYPSYLKNYVARATELAAEKNLLLLKQRSFKVLNQKNSCEIFSLDFEGGYDLLDSIIHKEIKRLSSSHRGALRGQIQKLKIALKNNKLGPLNLSGGVSAYLSYNHIYLGKSDPFEIVLNQKRHFSIEQFEVFLLRQKKIFPLFIKVNDHSFNTIKRNYPFKSSCRGKVSAIDLLRQWRKAQNVNKILNLAF